MTFTLRDQLNPSALPFEVFLSKEVVELEKPLSQVLAERKMRTKRCGKDVK